MQNHKITCSKLILLGVIGASFMACMTPKVFKDVPTLSQQPQHKEAKELKKNPKEPAQVSHSRVSVTIPMQDDFGSYEINAEVFRPNRRKSPKTIVIIVPGAGNISRQGEVLGDGIDTYPVPLEMATLWAESLAERGMYVLTYDKRTCTTNINPICKTNDQASIDELGINALAHDLDQVFNFAKGQLSGSPKDIRFVLLSSTQGAQTVALANCKKDISGVVLLSPVIGDLEMMWITGLQKAADHAKTEYKRNQLLNRKESMAGFFKSQKKGDFPENAKFHGATIKFWQSWIDASRKTPDLLKHSKLETLMLFNENDAFFDRAALKGLSLISNIKIETTRESDRNFVTALGVPARAVDHVASFIQSLPLVSSLTP